LDPNDQIHRKLQLYLTLRPDGKRVTGLLIVAAVAVAFGLPLNEEFVFESFLRIAGKITSVFQRSYGRQTVGICQSTVWRR
jgi:hypothetical protein